MWEVPVCSHGKLLGTAVSNWSVGLELLWGFSAIRRSYHPDKQHEKRSCSRWGTDMLGPLIVNYSPVTLALLVARTSGMCGQMCEVATWM